MCRRNQLLGVALAGFGMGLVVACLFESTFFCGCVGLIAICAGVCLLKKKQV